MIRKRVDAYGVSEPVITPQGRDRILVQIPGLDTKQIETTKSELQRVAKLEFATVAGGAETASHASRPAKKSCLPATLIKTYKDKVEGKEVEFKLLVKRRAELSGEHVKRAYAYFDQQGYGVSLSLDTEGAKIFGDLTQSLGSEPRSDRHHAGRRNPKRAPRQ